MNIDDGRELFKFEPGDFLTVGETARLLRLTTSAVLRLKDRERLSAYKVGARWLFDRREIAMWLAARRSGEFEH